MSRKVWLYLLSACNCMHAALATKLHIVTYKFQVRSGFQVRNCVLKRLIQLPSAHNACQILVHSVRRAVQTVATTHPGMVEQGAIVISCFTTHRLGVFVHAHKIFGGVVAIIRGHEIAIVFFGPPSRAGDLCRRHQHSLSSCVAHSTVISEESPHESGSQELEWPLSLPALFQGFCEVKASWLIYTTSD